MAPRNQKKKTTAKSGKKNKAFGTERLNLPGKKKAKTRSNAASRASSTREIDDEEVVFIQERKDQSGKLHLATIDDSTGDYVFTPKGRGTPIPFDPVRHTLVKEAAHGKSDKSKNKRKARDTLSDDDDDSMDTDRPAPTTKRSKRANTRKTSYMEIDEESSEDEESDYEAPVKKKSKRSKVTMTKKTQRRGGRGGKAKRKRSDDDTNSTVDESDDEMGSWGEPSPKHYKKSGAAAEKRSSPFAKTSWEEGGDWRSFGAIDY